MNPETKTKVTCGLSGLAFGIVITMMVAFKGGFLITKSDNERLVNAAVLANRADICVAQFTKDPGYPDKSKEFKALNFIDRDAYIQKGGWDRMPGEAKASDGVNRVCGDKLAASMEK